MVRIGKLASIIMAAALVAALFQFGSKGVAGSAGAEKAVNSMEQSNGLPEKINKAVVLYIGSPVAYVSGLESYIDAANMEVAPIINNGRTLVPVRFVSEKLGAQVDWDDGTSTASVSLGEKCVKLAAGSNKMLVGREEVSLEAPAMISNGRLMVPLRALVEALGKKVFYDKGLIIVSDDEYILDPQGDKSVIDSLISKVNNLPVVGTYDKLKELVKNAGSTMQYRGIKMAEASAVKEESNNKAKAADSSAYLAGGAGYSKTNVQVEGVDEGDVVKTDGEFIYQVNKQRIIVVRAEPADNMKIESVLELADKNFDPREIYLHDNKMAVIGTSLKDADNTIQPVKEDTKKAYLTTGVSETVKAIIYDISDRANIVQLREIEAEGGYISSRKIGAALYLISSKYINYYILEQNTQGITPGYRDTAIKDDFIPLDYTQIRYFPDCTDASYMTIAAVNLDKNDEAASISAYLGAGSSIYASSENLYVAAAKHPLVRGDISVQPDNKAAAKIISAPRYENNTAVYKFSMNEGKITYLCKGEIPGQILNQFSMDENGKNFRIATTVNSAKVGNGYEAVNNVYITDDMLNITGRLENMAPGERIYSVRFMGNRAYVVTFRNIDPLFVIDMKDPCKPSILGALKIPGYSDYLHPYDENHIIGFGKDTIEVGIKDFNGDAVRTQAYYQGMKLALFDVSDVSNPKQKFTEIIGDRGTESELLRNHKALLFSKEKNLLAFPVTVAEIKNKSADSTEGINSIQYGTFTFQGAYVYSLDAENGFKLKGRITHLSDEEYLKSGNSWYGGDKTIERIIYIGDKLYTLSDGMIKVNDMSDLKEINKLDIP